jgi:Glycosyl hydrolase catalytic core
LVHHNRILALLIILSVFLGCKDKSTPSGSDNNTPPAQNKSSKRGIAYNLTSAADLAALSNSVCWWYNWNYTSGAPANYNKTYGMEFIPMLWGGNTSTADINGVKNFIIAHPEVKYLLVMNEPNLTDQANRTPSQAAIDWLNYEQVVNDLASQGRTVYLVGPAISWGTMTGYSDPVVWLDAFYSEYKSANGGRIPQIDYLAFHWYDYGLSSQLDRLQKYGKKIWITEMANWNAQINSYAKQEAQMRDMVNTCETRSDVFRYAWFIGRGNYPDSKFTYLFTSTPGELTELGKLYVSLPYTK